MRNRKLLMLKLILQKDGLKRADYLKKNKIFHNQGENCYYHPWKIPSEPFLMAMHNNVVVCANVTFVTHDILNRMLDYAPKFKEMGTCKFYMGTIELFDNVFIGANSIIMYNTKIGSNSIVAAGSVVTKDVPEGAIVGGNPAVVIGYVDELVKKRLGKLDMPARLDEEEIINKYFWNNNI